MGSMFIQQILKIKLHLLIYGVCMCVEDSGSQTGHA